MTTNELTKLRIEVAEKRGYSKLVQGAHNGWLVADLPGYEGACCRVPEYTEDHNAAFTIVTALAKEGWNCTTESCTDGTHYVSFWKDTVIKKDEEHSAHADTLPVAICLAFKEVKQSK